MISGLICKDLMNIRGTAAYMMVVAVIFSAVFSYSSIMVPVMMLSKEYKSKPPHKISVRRF